MAAFKAGPVSRSITVISIKAKVQPDWTKWRKIWWRERLLQPKIGQRMVYRWSTINNQMSMKKDRRMSWSYPQSSSILLGKCNHLVIESHLVPKVPKTDTGIQIKCIDSDLNRLFNFVEADFTVRNSGVYSAVPLTSDWMMLVEPTWHAHNLHF